MVRSMKSSAVTNNSISRAQILARARESFAKQAWTDTYSTLLAADETAPLEAEDLQSLAVAAQLTGKETEGGEFLARAHQGFLGKGETRRAARCAFWLGFVAQFNGEMAQASGWLARARRLLEGQGECVELGYLLLPEAIRLVIGGEADKGHKSFVQAAKLAKSFGDRDLWTLALNGQGRALIRMGEISRGVTLLDEAMVAVMAGEVSPLVAGGIYCSVIESCRETFDFRRAQEWTAALTAWCASQPDIAPYRGACLLHRAEIMQMTGAWPDAFVEARRAHEQLLQAKPKPVIGSVSYFLAELHRLRGEFSQAEKAYRQAEQWQSMPKPGLALLRLVQGEVAGATAAIQRVMDEVRECGARARALDAYVEIALARKDIAAARAAADEMAEIAARHGALLLRAMSSRATGAVLLAEGKAREASVKLRESYKSWSEIGVPYEAARTRVLLARVARELNDSEGAAVELAEAREVFQQLGAAPDLACVEEFTARKKSDGMDPLTEREMQVLKLVASGVTNRKIAVQLVISEKTVARHVSNIFNKLGLNSRAAATAYAYRQGLA